jgi:nitrite reductase/ring-hydroxylating ferredoxin subunit
MAIASVNGQPCAFQEYCTHRYGPLSEGALHDGQVTCPWHGSRFDARSGEVKQGPVKEAIRTFEAQIREGKIQVRAPEP